MKSLKKTINFLQEFSIPLILGVIGALIWVNIDIESYQSFVNYVLFPFTLLGHKTTLHFLVNDLFMVFFFGIAIVEIVQAVGHGGCLNPISKAINPLYATAGGVIGPVLFLLPALLSSASTRSFGAC